MFFTSSAHPRSAFHCLKVQNEFIQDIIDTDELGPCLKIEYFFDANHPTPSVPSQEFAKDLTNGSQIILQLAYWYSDELHAYGLFFDTGKAKWERIEVSSTYWAAGVN